MSEGILSTLITVLGMLATFLLSQWLNSRSQAEQSKERREERRDDYQEWYRRTLFEKRLAAVQEAYAWLQKIKEALDNTNPNDPQYDPQSEASDVLRKPAREAREWYDNNAIFLHDELPERSLFIGLLNSYFGYSYGRTPLNNPFQVPGTPDADAEYELGVLRAYLAAKTMITERARKLLELESEHQQANDQ